MSNASRRLTRHEQKEATRALFLRVGRRVFAKHGFDATSVGAICGAARTTHGALYHHFESKTELFSAVLAELMEDVARRVRDAADGAAARGGTAEIDAACRAYLDACGDPVFQAIVLRDGPRVLRSDRFTKMDRAVNEPVVVELLDRWMDAGILRRAPSAVVARMLGGAFAEAGAAIAEREGEEAKKVRAFVEKALRAWIRTLER